MDYFVKLIHGVSVRPNDLDSLGHVNNAVVLEYLELARWHWLATLQVPRRGRILPVVVRTEVDYLKEIGCEELHVTTQLLRPELLEQDEPLEHFQTYKATMRQEILRSGDSTLLG